MQNQENFKITATQNDTVSPDNLKFDNRTKKIYGFSIFSKRLDQVALRGTFKMLISQKLIFPANTDTQQFTTNASVPVTEKIYMFKEPIDPGNFELEIDYTDTDNALAAFVAYDLTFSFITEISDKS